MHEDFTRQEEVRGSSDRSFGLVMAACFCIVALLPLLHGPLSAIRWWALATAAAFLTLALLWTAPLRPLNRWWLKLGLLLFQGRQPHCADGSVLCHGDADRPSHARDRQGSAATATRWRGKKLMDSPRAALTGARLVETAVLRCACCRFCKNSGCSFGFARSIG